MTLWIATLFTANFSSAFWVSSPRKWCSNNANFPNCNSDNFMYNTPALQNNNYDDLNNLVYNNSSDYWNYVITNWSWILQSYNNWDYFYTYYSSSKYVKFSYNFINYWSNGWDWRNFYWRNDTKKKYNSFSSPNLWFGVDDLPWEYFIYYQPRDATWIFYNQDYASWLHTVQLIWDYQLVDRFLYVDVRATVDNVWLVDTANSVAWSTTVDDPYMISQILFWKVALNDQFFNEFGWDTWYDVSIGGGSFFPLTVWNVVCNWFDTSYNKPSVSASSYSNYRCRTSKYANIWLTYQQRYTTVVQPSYWNSDNWSWSVSTWSAIDLDAVRNFEGCLKFNNDLLYLANNQNSCSKLIDYSCTCTWSNCSCLSLSEYVWLQNFIKNYNGTWQYTGVLYGLSCTQWLDGAMRMYNSLPDSYSSYILTSISWASNPDSINVQNMCGMYPDPSSEQSWTCKYLGIGCSDFSFWVSYDQVKSFIKPFWDESIWVLITSFDSWFNYFNIPNCSSDYYWKSYGWANTIFIVFVAFIVFQIYLFFKS